MCIALIRQDMSRWSSTASSQQEVQHLALSFGNICFWIGVACFVWRVNFNIFWIQAYCLCCPTKIVRRCQPSTKTGCPLGRIGWRAAPTCIPPSQGILVAKGHLQWSHWPGCRKNTVTGLIFSFSGGSFKLTQSIWCQPKNKDHWTTSRGKHLIYFPQLLFRGCGGWTNPGLQAAAPASPPTQRSSLGDAKPRPAKEPWNLAGTSNNI